MDGFQLGVMIEMHNEDLDSRTARAAAITIRACFACFLARSPLSYRSMESHVRLVVNESEIRDMSVAI